MRTGPIVVGVILLLLGVSIVIGGAPIRGMGETATDYCRANPRNCDGDYAAGAMFVSMGDAMMWGGGLIALAGIGLIIAGVVAAPKPPQVAPAPLAVPVQAGSRPCPACDAATPSDAKYCNACGAAIAPVAPRVAP